MNDKRKKDELNELTYLDDEQIELIAKKYPVLNKSLKKRIAALCEEKLAMKKDDNYFYNDHENEETELVENVEIYRKTPWYRNRALTAAASFVLVFGAAAGIIAGIKKSDTNDNNMSSFSIISDSQKMTEADIIKELEECSTSLLESFNCVDKIYGGNIEKDMNSVITIGGIEYAEITDTRFGTKNDLLDFMNNCMTENIIDKRYGNMFDENNGQNAWCAESNGKLYGKVSARASGYTFIGEPTFRSVTDDTAEMSVNYDNYGRTDVLLFQLRYDGKNWKIDSFESAEITTIPTEPLSDATPEPVTAAPFEENTDAPVQNVTEAAVEAPANTDNPSSDVMEITPELAYEFINALDFIDQLGGNGAAVDYDYEDNFDDHDGNQRIRVTEPGFTCVADVRNYMRTYLPIHLSASVITIFLIQNRLCWLT